MKRRLTKKEREILLDRHRKERDGQIRDRIKAVLAYDKGYSYTERVFYYLMMKPCVGTHSSLSK